MRRPLIVFAVGGLAAVLLLVGGMATWYERPTMLRVAVSSTDAEDHDLILAAAAQLTGGRETVRLRLVPAESSAAAAAAVDIGKAELAVVRTDVAMPNSGQTVIILHRDVALLLAPASGELHDIADLAGHTVGIVRNGPANGRLLETVLAQYDVPAEAVRMVSLLPDEVAEAIRSKRVDAAMAVDVVSEPFMRDFVKAVTSAGGGSPVFIPVAEAAAIAQRSPAYDSTEIVRGAFGGSPPRPAEAFDTLSITHRLVASQTVDQSAIADLTRFFLSERPALAGVAPLARRIEAPSTDRGSALPVHAGAAAYIDDEEETFFDKYSDMIYMGAMVLGVLASGATAMMSRMNTRKAAVLDAAVGRLIDMRARVRAAATRALLDGLQSEADGILASSLDSASAGGDERRLAVFGLALDQVRAAIRDRRKVMNSGGPVLAANDVGPARAAAASE